MFIDSKLGLVEVVENLDLIQKKSITLNGMELIPGETTDLNGFFSGDVVYVGLLNDYMAFQIGFYSTLFGDEIYKKGLWK